MPRTWFDQLVVSSPHRSGRSRLGVVLSAGTHAGLLAALVVIPTLSRAQLPEVRNQPVTTIPGWTRPPVPVRIVDRLPARPHPVRRARPVDAPVPASRPVATVPTGDVTPLERLEDPGTQLCLTGCGPAGNPDVPEGVAVPMSGDFGEPQPSGVPVRVGGHVREPRKVHHVAPAYPDLARAARVEGIVIAECLLGERGDVEELRLLSGHPLLAPAALEAVQQWRYTPTLLNGVPVRVVMTVTVRFTLEKKR